MEIWGAWFYSGGEYHNENFKSIKYKVPTWEDFKAYIVWSWENFKYPKYENNILIYLASQKAE